MNRQELVSQVGLQGKMPMFKRRVFWWDLLTVLFACVGAAVVVLIVREALPQVAQEVVAVPLLNETVTERSLETSEKPWIPIDAYAPIFESRNIFMTDQEKELEAAQKGMTDAESSNVHWGDGYELAGVIVDGDPRAMVRSLYPPGIQTLSIGDDLSGAKLIGIESGRVVFEFQGKSFELNFHTQSEKVK